MQGANPHQRRLKDAADWLVRLSASDPPSGSEVQAWAAWCGAHEENQRAFEELERLWRATGAHPPSAAEMAVLLAPDQRARGRAARFRWWPDWPRSAVPRAVLATATTVAAVVLAAVLAILMARSPLSRSLSTGLGQIRSVMLGDGSHVTLGGLSTVEVQFTREQRLVTLSAGEILVEDEHHLAWPLIVSAGEVRALAKGTSFDVERGDDYVAVCVMDGLVEVSVADRRSRARRNRDSNSTSQPTPEVIELAAGDELVVYTNGSMEQHDIDPASAGAWRYGQMQFTDMSLKDAVQAIDRYARRRIVVSDPVAGSLKFTGTVFPAYLDAWLQSLPQIFPVTISPGPPIGIAIARR